MKQSMGFILIFTAMMVTILVLHGCASESSKTHTTGKMTCVGFCELDVGNRSTSVRTEHPDGTVISEMKKETGLAQDQAGILDKKQESTK